MSLAEARELARSEGEPLAESRRVQGVPTIAEVALRVVEHKHGGWRGRHRAHNWLRSLECYGFPPIGGRLTSKVSNARMLCSSADTSETGNRSPGPRSPGNFPTVGQRSGRVSRVGFGFDAARGLARLGGRTVRGLETLKIAELIAHAPWREAVTYRDSWPHEYVLSRKDGQGELVEAVCARFRAGEGVAGCFFGWSNTYLFIGDHKYWLMTHWDTVDLDDGQDYVLNRARLYRDRRDFVIQQGDTGDRKDYPASPPHSDRRGPTSAEA